MLFRSEFSVRCDQETVEQFEPMRIYFQSMANAAAIAWGSEVQPPATHATVNLTDMDVYVDLKDFIDVEAEIVRNEKLEQKLCGQIEGKQKKLSNAGFVERAPAEVVQREQESLVQLQQQLDGGFHRSRVGVVAIVDDRDAPRQPDLGTALLVACSGGFVLFFAGVRWRLIVVAALAAAAGVMVAALNNLVEPTMGSVPSYKALAIIVLGGLGNVKGTLVAAVLLGVIEAFGTIYLGRLLDRDAIAFAFLILVLMLRPQGLFGRA